MSQVCVRRRSPRTVSIAFVVLALSAAGCVGGSLVETEPGVETADAGSVEEPLIEPPITEPPVTEPPPERPPPGEGVFGDDQVLEVRLTLTAEDYLRLEEQGNEEIYLPAQAIISGAGIGETTLAQIGIRHKGAYSLHHCWDNTTGVRSRIGECAKLSYKLKFDKYLPDARLAGLKRLNLHASSADDTRIRELLAYSIFRDFGVKAPRTAAAAVYVNGAFEGLFIAVEAIDGRFTKAHFPEGGGDGNLYKEIWPAPTVTGDDLIESLRTNEDVADVSGFLGFAQAISATGHEPFAADMSAWVDLEHTLRYIAVDRALKNWDGIMAFYSPTSPHNFYWYHDSEGSGRFHLIPWDMDQTLWQHDPYMAPQSYVPPVPDWNEEPADCSKRPVWDMSYSLTVTPPRCDRFLDLLAETHFARFQEIAAELRAGPLQFSRLREKVTHYGEVLEPIVEADPYLDVVRWRGERDLFKWRLEQTVADFQGFVEAGLVNEISP